MENVKENAVRDFVEMISHSWTWDRMTDDEKCNFHVYVNNLPNGAITGSYSSRWHTMQAIYSAYLAGLGYLGGADWRKPDTTEKQPINREEYLRRFKSGYPVVGHAHY